ncbi:MAG: DUF5916 domain-containing protein [Gemmatimonadales bacterium]
MLFALNGSTHSLRGQQPASTASIPATKTVSTAGSSQVAAPAIASAAKVAPIVDGSDVDAVWNTATVITGFRVFDPQEDGEPRFRTDARVAYDPSNLYVFVRAFDPHPDSVISLLSRRDVKTQSDQIKIMVDSYHDRRTGYEFAVNPAGVKRDFYLHDDTQEDASWDAVWEVATKIDSLGWTAEFRIPLSQLRYPASASNTFGLMIMRDVARTNERVSWPVFRRSRPGVASQFGELANLDGLGSSRRLEIVPYATTKNVSTTAADGFGRSQQQSLGADIKYGLASNLTLDATVNPDFGQVEADPAVLNLSAFESFFEERRPFFVEGNGIFQFDANSVQLFYPRRIGRAPQLGGLVEDPNAAIPGSSTILGAAKITGRLSGGTSIGALSALTQRESVDGTVVEPRTAYGVGRVSHDFRKGESAIGFMLTDVNRFLDDVSDNYLRRSATVAGMDVRHRFLTGRYEATSSLTYSKVTGTVDAIARTQRSGVHLFQRVDGDLGFDPTRTSLDGTAIASQIEKVDGVVRLGASYQRVSPGFEINDIGFLSQADQQTSYEHVSLVSPGPRGFYRRANAQLTLFNQWNAAGLSTARTPELDLQATLRNSSSVSANLWTDYVGGVYCDRCARGGPALRLSPSSSLLVNWFGDPRARLVKSFAAIYTIADGGRSTLWRVRPYLTYRAASNVSMELGARYQLNMDNTQWYGNVGTVSSPDAHYLFAHLHQNLLSFQTRLSVTATPTLSLQFYGEPFVTTGSYRNIRELASPRASDYSARFKQYNLGGPAEGFNEKQFRSNTVVRWEYRPGSTVFFVWSQGRDQSDRDFGTFSPRRDYVNLFSARPDNTFLIKASYWLSF